MKMSKKKKTERATKIKRGGKKEVDSLRDQLARALADYDNLRKRVEEEKKSLAKLASLKLITKFLPVLDMLYNAQRHLTDTGLAIAINEFESVLKDEGVERIVSKPGVKFDEEIHEAIETIEKKDGKEGTIAEELLSGWRYVDGPVIRPSKVKVFG